MSKRRCSDALLAKTMPYIVQCIPEHFCIPSVYRGSTVLHVRYLLKVTCIFLHRYTHNRVGPWANGKAWLLQITDVPTDER